MTPIAYNTLRSGNRARVHGKWIAYSDDGWKQIDAAFRETPTGFVWDRGPAEYHVGRHLHDGSRIVANNRYDIFTHQPLTAPAAEFELMPIGGSNVAGQLDPPAQLVANYPHVSFATDQSQVWHPEAGGPGRHVRWTIHHGRAPRMTRELVVDPKACPQRALSLSWDVRSPRVLALVRNQSGQLVRPWAGSPRDTADVPTTGVSIVSVPDRAAADQIAAELAAGATTTGLRRGSGIKPPLVWYWTADGTLVTAPATVRAEIQGDGETVRFTKTIPLVVIQAAAAENSYLVSDDSQTISPDPNNEVNTHDAYLRIRWTGYTQENYDELVALSLGTTAYSSDSQTTLLCGTRNPNYLSRVNLLFDVSSLSGMTVSDVVQGVTVWATETSRTFRVTGATTASNTGYNTTDFQNTYLNNDASLHDSTFQMSSNGVKTTTYNANGIAAVQAAIDGSGIVKTSLRDGIDSQSAPSSGGAMPSGMTYIHSAESSGTGSDPYLDVTYSAGGSTLPIINHYMMS